MPQSARAGASHGVFGANRLNRAVDTSLPEAVEGAYSPGLGSSSLRPRAWLVPAPVREKTDRRAEVNTAGSPRGGRMACFLTLS